MKRLLGAITALLLISAGPALAARSVDLNFDNVIERPGVTGWWENGAIIGAPFGAIVDGVLVVQKGQYGSIACCGTLKPGEIFNHTLDVSSITFLSPVDVAFGHDGGVIVLPGSSDWQTVNFVPGEFRTVGGFYFGPVDRSGMSVDRITFTAVPEPATWAMMIMGFGLAGGVLRRRRALLVAN